MAMAPHMSNYQRGDNRRSNVVNPGGKQDFRGGMSIGDKGVFQLHFNLNYHQHSSPLSSEVDVHRSSGYTSEDGSDGSQSLKGLSTKTSREGDVWDGSETASRRTYGSETSWDEEQERDLDDVVLVPQETFRPMHPHHNIKTSPEKPHIQARKAIAVVNWPNWNIRVYFQDSSRHIQEVCQMERNDGAWNITPGHIGIEDAKQGTPLAVISRFSGSQIRLYYISDRNTIHGWCFFEGKGWSCDSLNDAEISVSPYSNLTAVASATGIRIYYQSTDGSIYECSSSDTKPWKSSKTPATALLGSALAATAFPGGEGLEVHLYYQNDDLKVYEHIWDGSGWESGSFPPCPAQRYTTLATISWALPCTQIRVYLRSKESKDSNDAMQLLELKCKGDDEWDDSSSKPAAFASIPEDAQLAVIPQRVGGSTALRVYFVDGEDRVGELGYNTARNWSKEVRRRP